ncbi:MAG: HAD family hydrolase, partial [Bacteroidetes bacterium]
MNLLEIKEKLVCFHCGEDCRDDLVLKDENTFCCDGCRLVYEILTENKLDNYYCLNSNPGLSQKSESRRKTFEFLDNDEVKRKLLQFDSGGISGITLSIPRMHCSSCIWLLENLSRFSDSVIYSNVNFMRRELVVQFENKNFSLKNLVELLTKIGYEPELNLKHLEGERKSKKNHSKYYRIGIAGFAFGNIMLFSFPEYLSHDDLQHPGFSKMFNYLNMLLSVPVFFYCSLPFFRAAIDGIKQKFFNIDVPIALGILVMFVRSLHEILAEIGPGYLDTMTGLVFFMLIGRNYQEKSYRALSFDRDYKSFFPIAVTILKDDKEISVQLSDLTPGDKVLIRNEELVPADSIVLSGEARIDYSFVTGESRIVSVGRGELIYAGGRHFGSSVILEVKKEVSQSYLTELWNKTDRSTENRESGFEQLVNKISHYFTIAIVGIALSGLVYWTYFGQASIGWNAFTAVLIIACPCALAISSPFTLGSILRIFGNQKLYLRNAKVIEKLAQIDTVIFDKTGTLTVRNQNSVRYQGIVLSDDELSAVSNLASESLHPLSQAVSKYIPQKKIRQIESFREIPGHGIAGVSESLQIKIGSAEFVGLDQDKHAPLSSRVHLKIGDEYKGFFSIENSYREGIDKLVRQLEKMNMKLEVLSGDNEAEYENLRSIFGENTLIRFNQSPSDKLEAVKKLSIQGRKVMRVGDGLN